MLGLTLSLGALTTAHAAPTPSDVAMARELYKAGMDALDANDVRNAADKLAAAWQLAPTPIIGVGLSRAYERLGRLVEAHEVVLVVRRLEVAPGETARSVQARADADALEAAYSRRLGKLHVIVSHLPDNATVTIDGGKVPLASLSVDRPMNPGEHTIEVTSDGQVRSSQKVSLAEGERKDLTIDVATDSVPRTDAPPISTTTTAPPPADAVTAAPTTPSSATSPLVWTGAATLGVGLVVGTIFGALALNESSKLHDGCASDGTCPKSLSSDVTSVQTFSTISTIAFVVAGVGVAQIVVGLVLDRSHRAPRTTWLTALTSGTF